jgi:hypothetical protein
MAKKTTINEKYVQEFVAKQGYPEVGTYTEQKDLQKFYKHCTDDQLTEWVELEGLEYNPSESVPIDRMRKCMAILYKHFPKAPSTKKKSKYADYTNEALLQLAIDNDVVFEMTEDERILRMRAIMALRAASVIE